MTKPSDIIRPIIFGVPFYRSLFFIQDSIGAALHLNLCQCANALCDITKGKISRTVHFSKSDTGKRSQGWNFLFSGDELVDRLETHCFEF